jgi:hypothetical protein
MTANPAGCILTFDLANAPALVGGTITTEAGKPGAPLTSAGGVQVGGRLALQLATTACPKTWAELNETGLTGAKIVPTEAPTLRLLPAKLTAKVREREHNERNWGGGEAPSPQSGRLPPRAFFGGWLGGRFPGGRPAPGGPMPPPGRCLTRLAMRLGVG